MEPELLAACYRGAIEAAAEHGARSITFPAISCGAYCYPPEEAAEVALTELAQTLPRHPEMVMVRFVLQDQEVLEVFDRAGSRARRLARRGRSSRDVG